MIQTAILAERNPSLTLHACTRFVGDQSALEPGQYIFAANYTAYPYSRGSVHITGPGIDDPIDYDVGFFSDEGEVDLKKQVWAYKRHREIIRRAQWYRGEVAIGHPKFPAGSRAAPVESLADAGVAGGGPGDVPALEYSAEDDRAIEKFLRENVQTTWHSLGTCRMAPREDMGVVDGSLDVYGVEGLKVVDLSIPPENVGANTNNVRPLFLEVFLHTSHIIEPDRRKKLTMVTDCPGYWREGCGYHHQRATPAEELELLGT